MLWYLLPVTIGVIGGVIGYFILRKTDSKKARNSLIIGGILLVINIVLNNVMQNLFSIDTPIGAYLSTYGAGSLLGGFGLIFGVPAVLGYHIFNSLRNNKKIKSF